MTESITKTFMIDIALFDYRLHVLKDFNLLAASSHPPPPLRALPLPEREAFPSRFLCCIIVYV